MPDESGRLWLFPESSTYQCRDILTYWRRKSLSRKALFVHLLSALAGWLTGLVESSQHVCTCMSFGLCAYYLLTHSSTRCLTFVWLLSRQWNPAARSIQFTVQFNRDKKLISSTYVIVLLKTSWHEKSSSVGLSGGLELLSDLENFFLKQTFTTHLVTFVKVTLELFAS